MCVAVSSGAACYSKDSEQIKLIIVDIYLDRSTFLFISAKGGHQGGVERKKTIIANMKNIREYEK